MLTWIAEHGRRLRFWLRRAQMDKELAEEMALHRQLSAAAGRKFGNATLLREDSRAYWGWRWLDTLNQDLRYTFRILRKSPVFTTVAILSLALGIGANTAIFTLMESVLWKALPVDKPEQLRMLSWVSGPDVVPTSDWGNMGSTPEGGKESTSFAYSALAAFEKQGTGFESICAFKPAGRLAALIDGRAELVRLQLVSGNYFETLGARVAAGRAIESADDVRGKDVVGVISYGYWSRRFGHDASAIGKSIVVNEIPVTIVGVSGPGFTGTQSGSEFDIFLPLTAQPRVLPWRYAASGDLLNDHNYWWVLFIGRLRAGADERAAQSALDVTLHQFVSEYLPERKNADRPHVRLIAGSRGLDDLKDAFSTPVYVLSSLCTLVLLVACVNLASLLLARSMARQREISVRLALGAGRGRIRRQMLTEGLALSLLGGAAGVLLGYWLRDVIPTLFLSSWDPNRIPAEFDTRVLLLSVAVTLLTGILFSLAPAWQSTRSNVNAGLKEGGRNTAGRSRMLAGKALVMIQIALCVPLLVGAGLFVRTLSNLKAADLGFQAERILLFNIDPPRNRYSRGVRTAFFRNLEARIAAIPGVQSASLSETPLVAGSSSTTRVAPVGDAGPSGEPKRAWVNQVGHRFFETMGIAIRYGRPFTEHDDANAPPVAIVNEKFAKQFFPDEVPLGRSFKHGNRIVEIVGICADARFDRIRTAVPPTFYFPYTQAHDIGSMTFGVKTAAEPNSLIIAVRRALEAVNKDIPIFDVRTQTQQIDATISRERVFAALATAFGLLALTLACIGIYGVMAHAVARRSGDIGIRIALGAQSRQVLRMILGEAVLLTLAGVVVGVAAAAALTRYVRTMLYGLEAFDPLTFVAAVAIMGLVAILAGWWPARTASRVDPLAALRHE